VEPLRRRTQFAITLGILGCVVLAALAARGWRARAVEARRAAFVAAVLEEARTACMGEPDMTPATGCFQVNARTAIQLLAEYGGRNAVIAPELRGEVLFEISGLPPAVTIDAIALRRGCVARVERDAVRIELGANGLDDDALLEDLSARLVEIKPRTDRARSLHAAIALLRHGSREEEVAVVVSRALASTIGSSGLR